MCQICQLLFPYMSSKKARSFLVYTRQSIQSQLTDPKAHITHAMQLLFYLIRIFSFSFSLPISQTNIPFDSLFPLQTLRVSVSFCMSLRVQAKHTVRENITTHITLLFSFKSAKKIQEKKFFSLFLLCIKTESPVFGIYCNEVYQEQQLEEALFVWETRVWGRKRRGVGGFSL